MQLLLSIMRGQAFKLSLELSIIQTTAWLHDRKAFFLLNSLQPSVCHVSTHHVWFKKAAYAVTWGGKKKNGKSLISNVLLFVFSSISHCWERLSNFDSRDCTTKHSTLYSDSESIGKQDYFAGKHTASSY